MSSNMKRADLSPRAKSKTDSTPGRKIPFDPEIAMEILQRISEELNERRHEMQSLQDFSKALEGAKQDDLRLYWDVRLIRGEDSPFRSVQGVSTLPGLLSSKMKGHAPSMIQQEVIDKIAQPLTAALMQEGEAQNSIQSLPMFAPQEEAEDAAPYRGEDDDGDSVERIANEMEGNDG